jgi:crossover junction endodeoxyribonuclease RuvC
MILGIDPGLENTGWGIIENDKFQISNFKLIKCGVIVTSNRVKSTERLGRIYLELEKIIEKYKVTEMAIETLFFAKNAKSAIKVSEAIGVIKLCGLKNGLEVAEYTPLQVKMALVGYGRAEKEQVEIMVRETLGLEDLISPSHASDAVAVALTRGFMMKG